MVVLRQDARMVETPVLSARLAPLHPRKRSPMTPVEIALAIVSVLLLISRFINAAKPAWDRMPKPIAVLLPPVVALIPQITDLIDDTKTWSDLINYLIAAAAMIVVGLFPKKADDAAAYASSPSVPPTRTTPPPSPPR